MPTFRGAATGHEHPAFEQLEPRMLLSSTFGPNDTIPTATPVSLDPDGQAAIFDERIGDGLYGAFDVDIYRLDLPFPGVLTVEIEAQNRPVPSSLDSFLRLFDSDGDEIASNDNFNGLDSRLQLFIPEGGPYYVGVSGFPNTEYDPFTPSSGVLQSTGVYNIFFNFQLDPFDEVIADSGEVNLPVPLVGTIGTTTHSIEIFDTRTIIDVNVRLELLHTFTRDLEIRLISPVGTTVDLALRRGGDGQNYSGTVFDDSAPTPISAGSAPFTGSFRPETPLADLIGLSAAGEWTLEIADVKELDSGVLVEWGLDITVINDIFGPFETNDTITLATDLGIQGTGSQTVEAVLGDGAFGVRDVDFFRFVAGAGTTISATITPFDGIFNTPPINQGAVLRLFDEAGNQLRASTAPAGGTGNLSFVLEQGATLYIGVSGVGNADYDPFLGGSGDPGSTGAYRLQVSAVGGLSDGALTLDGQQTTLRIGADGSIGADGLGLLLNGNEFIIPLGAPQLGESFFGAIFDGFIFRNAGPGDQSDVPFFTANYSDPNNQRVVTEGRFRDLQVRRSLSFGADDRFVAIDVRLTNLSGAEMNSLAWVEAFNPAIAFNIDGTMATYNSVDNQTQRLITASAGPGSGPTIGLGAPAPTQPGHDVVVSAAEPFSIRDPFQVISSPFIPNPGGGPPVLGDRVLSLAYNLGMLAPGETVTFRYFIFAGASPAEVNGAFAAMEQGSGTGHLVADPASGEIAPQDLPYTLYYPEGFASPQVSAFIPIVNPNAADARVVIIARYETGERDQVLFDSAADADDGVIKGRTRDGITITTPDLFAAGTQTNVASLIPDRDGVRKFTPFALEIWSSVPIAATLSHFDFDISTGEAFTATTDSVWTFGEGFRGAGVNDFVVFQNVNDEVIKVTMTVYPEHGGPPLTFTQTVEGLRRSGFSIASLPAIPDGPFGVKLDAEGPIVAALTHFDTNIGGGFGALGMTGLGSLTGAMPEGRLGLNADNEFVAILNAGSSAAKVTVTFHFETGGAFRQTLTIPAERRGGLALANLPNFPSGEFGFSASYVSDQPVSVTFPSFSFDEATGTPFSAAAQTVWLVSEGFRPAGGGDAVQDYLRIFTSDDDPVTVQITLFFAPNPAFNDPGGAETFIVNVKPRAANEFNLHEFISGDRAARNTFFGAVVKAADPVVVFAGHIDEGLGGGFGTLATPLGILRPIL